jgi:hypothetical protein
MTTDPMPGASRMYEQEIYKLANSVDITVNYLGAGMVASPTLLEPLISNAEVFTHLDILEGLVKSNQRIYETERAQLHARIAELEAQLVASYKRESEMEIAWSSALSELADTPRWEPVEYRHIFTEEGYPLRPDYEQICDMWSEYNYEPRDSEDYEYAICRQARRSQAAP